MPADVREFMATMAMPPQPLPLERAVGLVREWYAIEARARRLTGERDENFHLVDATGREYVLKVAHPAEEAAVSALTTGALLHLEREDPQLPCPRVLLERGGRGWFRFTDEAGRGRTARLLSYLPGEPLAGGEGSAAVRAACGRLGGRLTRALRSFSHPAAHRAIVWDVRHAGYLRELLAELPDFPCRGEAQAVLARIVPRIDSHFPGLRQQVVHNDLNPRNLLTQAGELAGIIDFGDMTHTAIIADVAVAAAENLPEHCTAGGTAATDAVRDVAGAYHELVPLHAAELEVLGSLVAARLIANLVVHEWHVQRNPAGEHYRPLAVDFMRERLQIAAEFSLGGLEL
ncbi:MAG TPA: phosphotransferase [Steroidobacteraceae bacterium]|nr:phosphotransferase [Steroidobacteraceae bacterium]